MKFIAIKSNIKEAITIVEKAITENNNLPILKNILITAENNLITFRATNLEMAICHKVAGKIIENGKITVPLPLLSGLVGNIQSDRLNFEKKGNDLEVTTDSYHATLRGLAADDFPITPEVSEKKGSFNIKGAFLKDAIQQVAVASQFSDLRPELSSILFSYSVDDLRLAATDGFRLAEKTIPSNLFEVKKKEEPFKMLVPLKTSQEAARIIAEEDIVAVCHDENQVLFKTEKTELISRLVEGNFPDYSAIIPHEFAVEVVVGREDLAGAIKLTGVFGQKNSEVKMKIHSNKKALEMSSADQALGENSYTLPAKIKGEGSEVYFNWRYLADPIKGIRSDDIFIGLQEDVGPALIRATDDASYLYILKPILKA